MAPSRFAIVVTMPFLTIGGAEAAVSQICRQLHSQGFRIFVVTTAPALEVQGDAAAWFAGSATIISLPRMADPERWPEVLFNLLARESPRILWQVGSSFTYELLPEIRRRFPEMAVVDLLFNPAGHTANYLRHAGIIDHAVTEHAGMKAWLAEHGAPEERISVIPNGIDLAQYVPGPKRDWRTGQARSAGGPFVAAFIGRLSEEKGPDLFVETAAQFRGDPAYEFLVCGRGPMERRLATAAREKRAGVHFLGFVSGREYLRCCDVTVVPSRLDGRPNVVMESLATGVPVIASRVGGIPEMAGEGAILCDPGDIDAYSAAIRLLASDRARYEDCSRAARRHAEAHFSIAERGREYTGLFERLSREREGAGGAAGPWADCRIVLHATTETFPAGPRGLLRLLARRRLRGHVRNFYLFWKIRSRVGTYFSTEFYEREYPDVKRWKIPALLHFVFIGFLEGRNPSQDFDTRLYLLGRPDVARAGINPLLHYLAFGRAEQGIR
jgi:glycosyltransferase involved in cell wall biosynthesis